MVGEKVGGGRQIRRKEQGLDDPAVALGMAVKPQVPPREEGVGTGAGVAQDGQHRGQEDKEGQAHPQHRLEKEPEEPLKAQPETGACQPHKEVEDGKDYFPDKEPIVDNGVGRYRQGKNPSAVVEDKLLQGDEEQGIEDHGLMEMVKKDIIDAKAGKRIEQSAHQGVILVADKPGDKSVPCQRDAGEFQHQQRRHQVGNKAGGEEQGQPEKGAHEKVKAVGADKVGP